MVSRPEDEDAAVKPHAVEDALAAFLALRRLLWQQGCDDLPEVAGDKRCGVHGPASCHPHRFATPSTRHVAGLGLTEDVIAAGMARAGMAPAQKVAYQPGDHRSYAVRHLLQDARASCTPQDRCKIGWIVSKGGPERWDVWLDVQTGEGGLRRRTD